MIVVSSISQALNIDAAKRHKAQADEAHRDERYAQTAEPFGYIAVLELFTNPGKGGNRQRPADTCAQAEDRALGKGVVALDDAPDRQLR